ncbi:MAG: EFR1 family ferrodoxin [Clostridiales bacterium]|nr:EFR1 family ferrodoxin [Candidatus Cacconaster stercorequi]
MIIYFSATGNSKYVAQQMADLLCDTAVSATDYIREKRGGSFFDEKRFVFIGPVYVSAPVVQFEEFLRASQFSGAKNAWFLATGAGEKSDVAQFYQHIAHDCGLTFMGSAHIKMPQNYLMFFKTVEQETADRIVSEADPVIAALAERIRAEQPFDMPRVGKLMYGATVLVRNWYYKSFMRAKKFTVSDACIGCGLCARSCPMNNIRLDGGKPVWGKSCIHCTACINRCPTAAIDYGKRTKDLPRYQCRPYHPAEAGKRDGLKVVLAGAYGKLGSEILKELVSSGHRVIALGTTQRPVEGLEGGHVEFRKIDVTDISTLKGTCDGADVVISTVGMTGSSATQTNYDIDYQGNCNLLQIAKEAGVRQFVYTSVIKADEAPDVPMVHAKYLFEQELKASGLQYVILRPTGYFYDIVKVFRPMIEKGSVSLLGKKDFRCNVIHTPDLAEFAVAHMLDENITYSIGGSETYTYRQIAEMCFAAANKKPVIKSAPEFLFSVLARLPKNRKNGKWAIIKFSKFTLTHDLVGDTVYGAASFRRYIQDAFAE